MDIIKWNDDEFLLSLPGMVNTEQFFVKRVKQFSTVLDKGFSTLFNEHNNHT